MPELNYEYVIVALFCGSVVGTFFDGWRWFAVATFVVAWQLWTPARPLIQDIPLFLACFGLTELTYRVIMNRIWKRP